ncbi:hypothetical protein HanXRQr2_Chr17g0792331 [Helianthus annuus]|uniref:Uncharacterized protein n=1 Tax=Helianthus annuus TaxID=4232 RepID=A0A9K3DFY3_HELAN|nr:hypothetical protein HanXRQr2_Chr17g0792331 [Helianthus annuus]KAJ0812282.1 hypothetical protein HanPSC8_Chr17g0760281 [Helianthus annuus]
MVKTKEKARSSSSSSSKGKGKQPEQQPKKRQYLGRVDESESGSEEEMELDPAEKPIWNSGVTPLISTCHRWARWGSIVT